MAEIEVPPSPKQLRERLLSRTRGKAAPVEAGEIDGVKYWVRHATVAERSQILQSGGIRPTKDGEATIADLGAFQTRAVVLLVCDETGTRIFDDLDFDALMAEQVGGIVDVLGPKATAMINVDPSSIAKK